ncbi:unnamed protein product [Peronospora destructor]|uniref:Uncharacterized protein n=1 Tax=Peronospora destructor TaxID=86335 RepID=A0AAV0VB58_9STRA|nr:unnamed protein product [Peronospora destructor]
MPWNANNNPAGDIRAPAIAAALRLKQQKMNDTTAVWTCTLRIEELDELALSRDQVSTLRHCALLHPDDFPIEASGRDGAVLMHPRLHAQFVVAVL